METSKTDYGHISMYLCYDTASYQCILCIHTGSFLKSQKKQYNFTKNKITFFLKYDRKYVNFCKRYFWLAGIAEIMVEKFV